MSSMCPVCKTQIASSDECEVGGNDGYKYPCPRCGTFWVEELLSFSLADMVSSDVERMVALSHWIRTEYEGIRKEASNRKGPRRKMVMLDKELVNAVISNPRPPLVEQVDNYVRWIGDNIKVGGQYAPVDRLAIQAIVGSANEQEFELVSHHLISDLKFIDHGPGEPGVWRKVTLSFDGWERYRELKRAGSDSRKAFMAMKYGDEQLNKLVEDVLKPAVKETGFDLCRLVDTPQPAGLIDDRLRVEIRASRFLIADLTHENAGAYWEAGYAEGLGKPVIYTCEKEKFENSETHFDTNHHLTVLWESEKPEDVAEKLKATIRATLPGEAKLTDDVVPGAT